MTVKSEQMAQPILQIENIHKVFPGAVQALFPINLNIKQGEIFALLGPNGAGKSTLINIICGVTKKSSGDVWVNGFHFERDFQKARACIGLVPQELTTDAFETVWNTVNFSRGLFNLKKDHSYITELLKKLNLYEKKDTPLMYLSGGMKRRVLIAKALAHRPQILFLDEPTAGVDVELRKQMWELITYLQQTGVTIILTTHYLQEAEFLAHRIGIIRSGSLILVEDKKKLMQSHSSKRIHFYLTSEWTPPVTLPRELSYHSQHHCLVFNYRPDSLNTPFGEIISLLNSYLPHITHIETLQNNLEDIFIDLTQSEKTL